jgi:hypothetical protein
MKKRKHRIDAGNYGKWDLLCEKSYVLSHELLQMKVIYFENLSLAFNQIFLAKLHLAGSTRILWIDWIEAHHSELFRKH